MERPRCAQCRNPIRQSHAAVTDGDRCFHEDCWDIARTEPAAQPVDVQAEYEQQIATGGLAALLSPYVSTMPAQRESGSGVQPRHSVPA